MGFLLLSIPRRSELGPPWLHIHKNFLQALVKNIFFNYVFYLLMTYISLLCIISFIRPCFNPLTYILI